MDAAEAQKFLPATNQFLESVVRLRPRVAAFDCDGTLWSGDAGVRFFDWELERGNLVADALVLPLRQRYAAYRRGEVDETTMCGEMVTMHRGISELKMMEAARQFVDQSFTSQIFPEMLELVRRLQQDGCEIWAVSSTNEWVIRAAMKYFGIPENRVLAAKVALDGDLASDRLVRVLRVPANHRRCARLSGRELTLLSATRAGTRRCSLWRNMRSPLIRMRIWKPLPGNAAGQFSSPKLLALAPELRASSFHLQLIYQCIPRNYSIIFRIRETQENLPIPMLLQKLKTLPVVMSCV